MLLADAAQGTPSSTLGPAAPKDAAAQQQQGTAATVGAGPKKDGGHTERLIPSWGIEGLLVVVLAGLAIWLLLFAARQIPHLCFTIKELKKDGARPRTSADRGADRPPPRDRIALTMVAIGGTILV